MKKQKIKIRLLGWLITLFLISLSPWASAHVELVIVKSDTFGDAGHSILFVESSRHPEINGYHEVGGDGIGIPIVDGFTLAGPIPIALKIHHFLRDEDWYNARIKNRWVKRVPLRMTDMDAFEKKIAWSYDTFQSGKKPLPFDILAENCTDFVLRFLKAGKAPVLQDFDSKGITTPKKLFEKAWSDWEAHKDDFSSRLFGHVSIEGVNFVRIDKIWDFSKVDAYSLFFWEITIPAPDNGQVENITFIPVKDIGQVAQELRNTSSPGFNRKLVRIDENENTLTIIEIGLVGREIKETPLKKVSRNEADGTLSICTLDTKPECLVISAFPR